MAKLQRQARFQEIKPRVAEILGVEESKDWRILHQNGDFIISHYIDNSHSDKVKFGDVRGTIIDIETGEIVRQTFSHEIECVHDAIPIQADGSIILRPISGTYGAGNDKMTVRFAPDTFHLNLPHSGVAIDVWKDKNGEVHRSSLKYMDIDKGKSHQPDSLTYDTIWDQLVNLDPKILFNPNYKRSRYVHTFILSHPSLTDKSKELIGVGYATMIGHTEMKCSGDEGDFEPEPVDISKVCEHTSTNLEDVYKARDTSRKLIYLPGPISVRRANYHLRYGYYKEWKDEEVDPVLRTGEFVLLTDNETGKIYKILSSAYFWRSNMGQRTNNIMHNFHILANDAYRKTARNDPFKSGKYPRLMRADQEKIASVVGKGDPVVVLSGHEKLNLHSADDRLYNIWLCLLLAVPIHKQIEVLSCIKKYHDNIKLGAQAAIKIATETTRSARALLGASTEENEDGQYREDIIIEARRVCSIKISHRIKNENFKEERLRLVETRLREMSGRRSYKLIKMFTREVDRVERFKKEPENTVPEKEAQ